MSRSSICICSNPTAPKWADHHLEHTAAKEEFIIEQYAQVLEAAEDQYLRLGELFKNTRRGSFEEKALQRMMWHVREAMAESEECLRVAWESLWKTFEEESGQLFSTSSLYLHSSSITRFKTSRAITMSGIPVYTSSPIKASKVPGITAQTAGSQSSPLAPNPTTTKASSRYPPPRPGAPAMPAPTADAQRYAPLQPTPTTKTEDMGPPAPRPGALPVPKSAVPPPPKAGESYQPQPTTAPAQQTYPPQMALVSPMVSSAYQPTKSSTSTDNAAAVPYPVSLSQAADDPRRGSLEHPPGYHQNVYASELTSDQRRAQEAEEANNSSGFGIPDSGAAGGFDSDGVWNTAKKWAQQAGDKISATERDVWRKINKE
ncbi:hypothetical protein BUE80_DR006415 [Diplocarpon rosae]|nr:hypothetical protein BUE80_DR006415 [Diplocarpon rosae]